MDRGSTPNWSTMANWSRLISLKKCWRRPRDLGFNKLLIIILLGLRIWNCCRLIRMRRRSWCPQPPIKLRSLIRFWAFPNNIRLIAAWNSNQNSVRWYRHKLGVKKINLTQLCQMNRSKYRKIISLKNHWKGVRFSRNRWSLQKICTRFSPSKLYKKLFRPRW
jgi:hypothetical protein